MNRPASSPHARPRAATGRGSNPHHLLTAPGRPGQNRANRDPLDDAYAVLAGSARIGHGEVHGIDATVTGDKESPGQVTGRCQRKKVMHLPRSDLVDLQPESALEGRHPPVLMKPIVIGGGFEKTNGPDTGGHTGLGPHPRNKNAPPKELI